MNLMSKILKPPGGKVEHMSFFNEKRGAMVRRQDERTARLALTDDTKRAIMMDMCPPELERHRVLNSDRYDTHPKLKSAIRDYLEQMRHKSDPTEIGGIAGYIRKRTTRAN